MKVKYLEANGDRIPIKLSFYALKHFEAETKLDILQMKEGEDLTLKQYERLFWLSYVAGCKAEGVDQKYQQEEMEILLDDCYLDFLNSIPEFFPQVAEKKMVKKKS